MKTSKDILLVIVSLMLSLTINAQCNGSSNLCSKRYDQVAYLTTHNAFNTDSEGFNYPNQNYGIAQQLIDGVRAFMLDVYDLFGTPTQYHGTWLLGSQDLSSDLNEIRQFLDGNPNEVVTIILECYVSANDIESELNAAGLSNYLYTKPAGDWATLQEMIDDNTRLVILTDTEDASANQQWYHHVWDHAVETHYSVNLIGAFTNDYNRGDAINDLFIFNHFITDVTLGVGVEPDALIVNAYDFLMPRIEQHYAEKSKFPNFITLDFYDLGEGKRVVDSLNANHLTLDIPEIEDASDIRLYPNPTTKDLYIDGIFDLNGCSIQLMTAEGKIVSSIQVVNTKIAHLNVSDLPVGVYTVQIEKSGTLTHRKKLIIH